jgi:methyltransferase (TIGR00027 family)
MKPRPDELLSAGEPSQALLAMCLAAVRAEESGRANPSEGDRLAAHLAGAEGLATLGWMRREVPEAQGFGAAFARSTRIDQVIEATLARDAITQVVMLGAGMDTRAFRLDLPADCTVFELDRPAVIDVKERRLADWGGLPRCRRVAIGIDLEHADLGAALKDAGFDVEAPTLWIAEGLFVYVAETDLRRLLRTLATSSGPGSHLVADVVARVVLESPVSIRLGELMASLHAPFRFAVDNPRPVLLAAGWRVDTTQLMAGGGSLLIATPLDDERAPARLGQDAGAGARPAPAEGLVPLALGICGQGSQALTAAMHDGPIDVLTIDGYQVTAGFFTGRPVTFDADGEHRDAVLLETLAFSCNYRDKALILRMANIPAESRFYPVGSELCGRVIATGADVTQFRGDDRVMIDGYYGAGDPPWGLPTNHGSRSYQILPARKLCAVPAAMSDIEAAAFSIGAQTSFAMIRRAGVAAGTRVLITAGTSNTSLFLAAAASGAGSHVSVVTSSTAKAAQLNASADEVLLIDRQGATLDQDDGIERSVRDHGPFEVVLDPFADLYLPRVLPVMAPGGRYVTCGVQAQFPPRTAEGAAGPPPAPPLLDSRGVLTSMTRNLELIMNCLGTTDDLHRAVRAWQEGSMRITVDRVFRGPGGGDGGPGAGAFLSRTYCEDDRFGKVVWSYDGTSSQPWTEPEILRQRAHPLAVDDK